MFQGLAPEPRDKIPEGVVGQRLSSGEGPSLRPTDTMAPVKGSGVATETPSPGSEDAASGWRWSQREASTIWSVVTTEAARAWQPKGTDLGSSQFSVCPGLNLEAILGGGNGLDSHLSYVALQKSLALAETLPTPSCGVSSRLWGDSV